MKIEQTLNFKKNTKELFRKQKNDLDDAVRVIIQDPQVEQQKRGDLAEVRVYKFKMDNCLTLLSYTWAPDSEKITLLKLGTHENFYRDLKN